MPPSDKSSLSNLPESGDEKISGTVQEIVAANDDAVDIIVHDNDKNETGMWARFKKFSACIKSEGSHLRWRVAVMAGLIGFGTFYQMDIPGAIGMEDSENTIQKHFAAAFPDKKNAYTNEMNQALYSAIFYPNVIVPLITGVLIDRVIGPRVAALIFTGMNLVGATVFATGIAIASFPTMVLGRVISGCTQETIFVIRAFFVLRFFKASDGIKGLSLAFGIAVCMTRIGSLVTFPVTTALADSMGVTAAAFGGSFAALLSFFVAVGLVLVDRHAVKNKIINPIHHKDAKRICEEATPTRKTPKVEQEIEKKKICGCIPRFDNPFTLHQLTSLSLCFWMVCFSYNFFLPPVFGFMTYAKSFFERKWGLSVAEAVWAVSGYNIMSCISCLFSGVMIDTLGRNSIFLMVATGTSVLMHVLLTTTMIHPQALMMIYGVNHGLFMATVLPCFALVLHEASNGLGMGVLGVGNNLYMGIVPLITGNILDANTQMIASTSKTGRTAKNTTVTTSLPQTTLEGFNKAEFLMIGITIVCFCVAVTLFITDKWRNRGLCSSSPNARKRIFLEIARSQEAPDAVGS
eukprot:Tbor_TRINITY_DN5972_c0_g1::TRINITY_DN5972_c0_g1_i2::g.18628::m.18628